VLRDQPFTCKLQLYDFQASRKQNEKGHADIVGLKQDLATLDLSQFAEHADAIDLAFRQNREGLGGSVEITDPGQGRHILSDLELLRASKAAKVALREVEAALLCFDCKKHSLTQ